ncbi:MAG: hypothetical protein IJ184_06740 [Alphaproteobacteria bacterium]|nr:hypothetical protein [Alphaproteobacteria bacterium]
MTIKERCKQAGITLSCYYYRVQRLGWTPEKAFGTPKIKQHCTKAEMEDDKSFRYGKHKYFIFEEDFQKNLRRNKQAQVSTQLTKLISSGGAVSPNKSINQVSCSYRPAGPSADFDKACGGYHITILNHTKEGEMRFSILRTSDGKFINTNDPERFINLIKDLTQRYFGR